MLEYIEGGTVNDDATRKINDSIAKARLKEIWKEEYMLTFVHDKDVFQDGFQDGFQGGFDSRQDEVDALIAENEEKEKLLIGQSLEINEKDELIKQLQNELTKIKRNS